VISRTPGVSQVHFSWGSFDRAATVSAPGFVSPLSVQIEESPSPAGGTGSIGKVLGDRGAFDRADPSPSRDILPARACRLVALGILYRYSVDAIRPALARARRPRESVGGGNKTNLTGSRGNRPLSQRHKTGRHIGHLRRVARIHRRREQFHRHGKVSSPTLNLSAVPSRSKEHRGTLTLRRAGQKRRADANLSSATNPQLSGNAAGRMSVNEHI